QYIFRGSIMKASSATKLSLVQMRELVLQEMDHIPRWPKQQQSFLRQTYWLCRMNSLGKKAEVANDRSAVMNWCLETLAKQHPGIDFQYDSAFFDAPAREKP